MENGMSNRELLSYLFQDNFCKLSKAESLLLEGVMFVRVLDKLLEIFKNEYRSYQKLLKSESNNKEDERMEVNFLRNLINDILSTNEYTLEGIANVIRMPIDAVLEIASGINTNPSLMLAAKIIKLHSDVRRDFYGILIRKVVDEESVA